MTDTLNIIIAVLISVITLGILAEVLAGSISTSQNTYSCLKPEFSIQSTDKLLCTNVSIGCVAPRLVYNASYNLCTNASGVQVTNSTPLSGFNIYNESSSYVGMSGTEITLLQVLLLMVVLGVLAFAVKGFGLWGKSD